MPYDAIVDIAMNMTKAFLIWMVTCAICLGALVYAAWPRNE